MNWLNEWNAISGRIEGLISASNLFISISSHNSSDSYNVKGDLIDQAKEIYKEVENYSMHHRNLLPLSAQNAFKIFFEKNDQYFSSKIKNNQQLDMMKRYLTSLSLIKNEINYFLTDFEFHAGKRSERAFIHLQQCIIANDDVRDQWGKAFEKGEIHCEKLGGAHLLWHGIYAFKINGQGARTDLVFNEPLEENSKNLASAEAIVLTEWKKVTSSNQAKDIAEKARKQADLYATGILGGLELKKYRYIVLVSDKPLEELKDCHEEKRGFTYKHINIAVNPLVPSGEAKTKNK